MHLNPNQQKAIEFVTGPCLILAGAGSGKTRVITNKIAYLINQCDYQARNIAAVTFTNKAAHEMKERASQNMSSNNTRGLIVCTFHTLGLEIIKNEYKALGIKKNFSIFDSQDQFILLKELSKKWLKKDHDLLKQLSSTISNWKNNLIEPHQAACYASSERDKIFVHCYQLYNNQLKAYNLLDFDDLILSPTLLLRDNQEVLERWQQRINYLLVDEYQDTNTSQYELIKLLVSKNLLFTCVGDDDQSIYSWRGACPQNLVRLQEDFSTLHVIRLEQNYRSSQRILKSANILIANNMHIFKKSLFSKLSYGKKLKIITVNHEEDEAERVVKELISHHFIHQSSYSHYAILYRGNHQSHLFEKILIKNHIPYSISGDTSFFMRPEIKDFLAYLRVLTNPDDDSAFLRIINKPRREIGFITLQKLGTWANNHGISLFRASFDSGLKQVLTKRKLETLQGFTKWMQDIAILSEREPMIAIRNLINDIDYNRWLLETSPDSKSAEVKIKNINQLLTWMSDMFQGNTIDPSMTLTQVVMRFTIRDIIGQSETENINQVHLMTLHASKGLEFPYLYLVGMEEGLLPHQNSIYEDNVDEERRLAYVGITRAQKEIVFTLCRERRQYGILVNRTPSRFLLELPQEDLVWDAAHQIVSSKERMQQGQNNIANLRTILAQVKNKY
ncbi:ATP-dependent DNA helicase Rep [Candidatus Profftia lariciata]|uniref:DNA helicase Rep n=1 Tax=Candidatus Profftia lariciata TaxID=1987921 RepID=UPI001D018741|nr:DNA helicase Rep [Candidatus Profftia lariciata]UDG81743.1 ATP-dependent DNA helicase Rep [Candidatus Profftia lariciata]